MFFVFFLQLGNTAWLSFMFSIHRPFFVLYYGFIIQIYVTYKFIFLPICSSTDNVSRKSYNRVPTYMDSMQANNYKLSYINFAN